MILFNNLKMSLGNKNIISALPLYNRQFEHITCVVLPFYFQQDIGLHFGQSLPISLSQEIKSHSGYFEHP